MKWTRAKDGVFFGVCKGLARTFEVPVGFTRLAWVISVLFFGAGIWLYLMLAVSLPREDKALESLNGRLLGVCAKIALRSQVEVGLVRFAAICLALLSFGASVVGYIVLYFVIDNQQRTYSSDSKPVTPPVTT